MAKQVTLTSGPITSQLIRLSIPLLAANVLQQLYNIINSLVVTYYIGGDAFAALGVAESVMNLFIFVITGACMGSSVLVARFYGEQNFPRLRQQLFVSGVLIGGAVVTAVTLTLLFLTPLLRLIQTPPELMGYVTDYLRIILTGMLFTFAYNYLAATLRAIGNTQAALGFLLVSLGYNLAAAWVLVAKLELGIRGTALATSSAQLLSALLCFLYIRKRQSFLMIRRQDMRMDPTLMRLTTSYGAVAALQQSSLYLGKLMVQSAVNGISTAAISAFTATTRVENFSQAFGSSGCEAIAIFVAQNQGAGKHRRALNGFLRGGAMVLAIGLLFSVLLALEGRALVSPFLAGEEESIALGASYLLGHRPDECDLCGHHTTDRRAGHRHLRPGGRAGAERGGPVHRPGLGGHRPVPLHRLRPGAEGDRVPSPDGGPALPPLRRRVADLSPRSPQKNGRSAAISFS